MRGTLQRPEMPPTRTWELPLLASGGISGDSVEVARTRPVMGAAALLLLGSIDHADEAPPTSADGFLPLLQPHEEGHCSHRECGDEPPG